MDLWDALRVVFRRWYVVLPVFVVLMGVTFSVVSSLEPTYEATASLTLLPPEDEILPTGERVPPNNPYATPENGFRILTALLAEAFNGNDVAITLRESFGFGDGYSYDVLRDDGSPILNIVVEAPSPREALDGAVAVREVLDQVLLEQQVAAGVDDDALIASQTVSDARTAVELAGSRVRVAIGLGVASVVLAVAAAYVLDGVLASRRASAEEAEATDVESSEAERQAPTKATANSRPPGNRPSRSPARSKKRPRPPRPRG